MDIKEVMPFRRLREIRNSYQADSNAFKDLLCLIAEDVELGYTGLSSVQKEIEDAVKDEEKARLYENFFLGILHYLDYRNLFDKNE